MDFTDDGKLLGCNKRIEGGGISAHVIDVDSGQELFSAGQAGKYTHLEALAKDRVWIRIDREVQVWPINRGRVVD